MESDLYLSECGMSEAEERAGTKEAGPGILREGILTAAGVHQLGIDAMAVLGTPRFLGFHPRSALS